MHDKLSIKKSVFLIVNKYTFLSRDIEISFLHRTFYTLYTLGLLFIRYHMKIFIRYLIDVMSVDRVYSRSIFVIYVLSSSNIIYAYIDTFFVSTMN